MKNEKKVFFFSHSISQFWLVNISHCREIFGYLCCILLSSMLYFWIDSEITWSHKYYLLSKWECVLMTRICSSVSQNFEHSVFQVSNIMNFLISCQLSSFFSCFPLLSLVHVCCSSLSLFFFFWNTSLNTLFLKKIKHGWKFPELLHL